MRAREILDEDYNKSLENDLNNLLVAAKALNSQEIETRRIVTQLNNMGYSVNQNSIMLLLSRNPLVMNATPTMIKLTEPEGTLANNGKSGEDSASRVSDMAQKATEIG